MMAFGIWIIIERHHLVRRGETKAIFKMLRVPNQSQRATHYEWTPTELIRTNDAVLISAIEALLSAPHIPYLVTDRNVSVLAGSIQAFPRRILVGDCCVSDACGLLVETGFGRELSWIR